jgi:fructose-1,6-bisphosphatase/inositol monophosphatase family enzyme
VDKKPLLSLSLAKIMKNNLQGITQLVERYPKANIQFKQDGSPVTELDLFLSSHVELLMEEHFPGTTFYSEEKFSDWSFPLLALDPLDGTREYIDGRDEWAISIGVFQTEDFVGEGWVYNPKTQECYSDAKTIPFAIKSQYRGEVSRSEWKKGLFTNKNSAKFKVEAVGSIAYKLGRLSNHQSDFVVSLFPKNIWDIAGGTLLCFKAGMKFYSQGKEVTSVQKSYEPPLLWCRQELFSELSKIYP